jgi:D-serine deaminase-like pyridoxal phosphate-dependent protein
MNLAELPTPALLLDEARMQHNIQRMATRMQQLGVAFRPHVKTSKCIEVARRQVAAGACGITVSTLKEAEAFFAAGFADVLYAVGLAPNKIGAALALQQRGCALQVVLDSLPAAQALTAQVSATGVVPKVLIEVDCDGHRAGVPPQSDLLLAIGTELHRVGALHGAMTHAGASYELNTAPALQAMAEQERARTVHAAERLRAAGLPCPVVSVGSTPTALSAQQLAGVTEVRAGVYVFFDLVMAGVGVCSPSDIALSVLATVIGHQAERGWVITDAGWMALSRDRGTQQQVLDQGYGAVCDEHGQPLQGWIVAQANQEHGIVAQRGDGCSGVAPDVVAQFPIGKRLRILPNHACATAAQHGQYHVLEDQHPVADWPRFGGW